MPSTTSTSDTVEALIHFYRPGKGASLYTETLVSDNGVRLDTVSYVDPVTAAQWVRSSWQPDGLLVEGQVIATVRKHHYYQEWFGIMQLFDPAGNLLGSYSDILTPLEKRDGEYFVTDLFLDLWAAPDGACKELDWDEFEAAAQQGLIHKEQYEKAIETLRRLVEEQKQGRFPKDYL